MTTYNISTSEIRESGCKLKKHNIAIIAFRPPCMEKSDFNSSTYCLSFSKPTSGYEGLFSPDTRTAQNGDCDLLRLRGSNPLILAKPVDSGLSKTEASFTTTAGPSLSSPLCPSLCGFVSFPFMIKTTSHSALSLIHI